MENNDRNSLLIADDNTFNLQILYRILKHEYIVRGVSTGEACIDAAEKFQPDLILLDVLMPEMDGYQVFEALKNSEKTAHIPVIFITGLDDISEEIKCLSIGAVDYIKKPFDDTIIKLRVKLQIQNANQLREVEQLRKEIEQLKKM